MNKTTLPGTPPTAADYRIKVIAAWRLRCIEQDAAARSEYVGRHHRRP